MRDILEKLKQTVAEHGEWPAVINQDGRIVSFAELDEMSSRFASYLLEHGIGRNDTIAIRMPRSAEYIAVEVATMKAGAAFIPLDANLPMERVRINMRECDSKMLVTPDEFEIGMERDLLPQEHWATPDPHDMAFVCYSSGSTGNPKAAAQEYGCYDLIIESEEPDHLPYMRQGEPAPLRKAMPSGMIFISSVMIVVSSLYLECPLYLPPDELLGNIEGLAEYYRENQIEFVYMSSSSVQKLQDVPDLPLRIVQTGAEVASGLHGDRFPIVNCYSMSEIGYVVLAYTIREARKVTPVGKVRCGTEVCLIDSHKRPVSDGLGILCVEVPYFRGYLGLPALNKKSFVEIDGRRFLMTNDICERDSEGNYVVRGRHGDTVEIDGHLVTPAEVEGEIMRCIPELGPVAARGFSDVGGNNYLCVYYIADREWTRDEIRAHLEGPTPIKPHLYPRLFIRVDEFPYTPSSKVARRALPVPIEEDFERGGLF